MGQLIPPLSLIVSIFHSYTVHLETSLSAENMPVAHKRVHLLPRRPRDQSYLNSKQAVRAMEPSS